MLCRHIFGKTSSEFRRISRIYLKFAAPRPHEISEALTKQCQKNLKGNLCFHVTIMKMKSTERPTMIITLVSQISSYSADQIYPNYAYAYYTSVSCVYAYVHMRIYTRIYVHMSIHAYTRVYVPLLCIPLSFFIRSIVSQTRHYFYGIKKGESSILLTHHANE